MVNLQVCPQQEHMGNRMEPQEEDLAQREKLYNFRQTSGPAEHCASMERISQSPFAGHINKKFKVHLVLLLTFTAGQLVLRPAAKRRAFQRKTFLGNEISRVLIPM